MMVAGDRVSLPNAKRRSRGADSKPLLVGHHLRVCSRCDMAMVFCRGGCLFRVPRPCTLER